MPSASGRGGRLALLRSSRGARRRCARYLRSNFLPEHETCFSVYEAEAIGGVCQAVAAADARCKRIPKR